MARRLHASSQQEVVERALEALEHRLFWEGFDDEAQAYLEKFTWTSQPGKRACAGPAGSNVTRSVKQISGGSGAAAGSGR